jgi:hypothetical protein
VRPFVSLPGLLGPREDDGDSRVALLEPVNSEGVVAVRVAPLDL